MRANACFDYALNGIVETDCVGKIVDANPAACSVFAAPRHRLVGRSMADFLAQDAAHIEALARHFALLDEQGISHSEWGLRHRPGQTPRTIEISAVDIGGSWLHMFQDVTAQRESQRAIDAARREAIAANQAKSHFLAMMSHEIRTPLNGIIGAVEVLRVAIDHTAQQGPLERLLQAAQGLARIVDDVLDFSKIEAGKIDLEHAAFDLHELVFETRDLFALEARSKALELAVRLAADLPRHVVGDRLRFAQVLRNLLGNAIKFTARGHVMLTLETLASDDDRVWLAACVRDSGIGISAAQQRRIFEPFAQADASMTRRFGGTGLGLSITRMLVARMGGRIELRSTLGAGSEFLVSIPFDRAEHAPQPTAHSLLRANQFAGATVLVVEDDAISRDALIALLRHAGITVRQAESGAEALAWMHRAEPPNLIFMDVRMPQIDGLATTGMLRAAGLLTPVIALSACTSPDEIAACLAAGMNDFLPKPFSLAKLIGVLERFLAPQPALPGIDTAEALPRFLGDVGSLVRARDAFVAQHRQSEDTLARSLEAGDGAALLHQLHAIKGGAATLGARSVAVCAAQAETAASAGDAPSLRAALAALAQALKALAG